MRWLVIATLFLVGCSKTVKPMLQLEMYGNHQSVLYVVEQNGEIEYGGGIDAIAGDTTWKGTLSQEQLSELQNILRSEDFKSVKNKLKHRYEISIKLDDTLQEYTVPLSNSSAVELFYFLEESTISRIQMHLDALPKPSMDVISDRKIKGSKN
jgi:hypothetical protein